MKIKIYFDALIKFFYYIILINVYTYFYVCVQQSQEKYCVLHLKFHRKLFSPLQTIHRKEEQAR